MVPCHRSPLRCMFCNLAAWSGTSGSRWCYAIGTNIVACPATRPDCLVRHIGTSMVPCHRHPHRCMSSNSAIVVRHIGKSMVLCIGLHSVACPATRPDHRGQAHRKVDGSMPSACTSLHVLQLGLTIVVRHIGKSMDLCYGIHIVACSQLGLTVVVRHIGKPMVPCHRHPHRCLSCTKGV